ncbi:glycosyltransferase [Psychroserpens burtonensis]|uniref:Glycosyltransferase n=1 Tax=Psychroserpens burtonensis TaxID=49278 RepID=A0A5C7B2X6_9FLAO|nr:glycosyltransferase [Psychroserpens burtonensis]TXE15603.1 glycosyltransferase [Psychroserpens burtonensis]
MPKTNNKKVCIVASSLSKGGAERSSAVLSQMLYSLGYDVHIITILPGVDYEYSGRHLNLGLLKNEDDSFFGRIKRFRVFRDYIAHQNFDVIIDNRSRNLAYRELIISKLVYKGPVVYVIHNFNTKKAFSKYTWLNKWLYKNQYMTAVSQAASDKYREAFDLKNIRTLYNGFNFENIQALANEDIVSNLPEKFIVFFGRIDDKHKNLKLLLDSYQQSDLKKHNVKLLILGAGPDLEVIKTYATQLKLSNHIDFRGFIKNPYPYVKKAKFSALTSRFEGFPMVIPESLSLGVPVVSVDCNSGPKEVIKTGFNGILVENNSTIRLAEAFDKMILDPEFYNNCVSNCESSVEQFSIKHIMQSWVKLIKEVVK